MRILIINPNSDPAMTSAIQQSAQSFADGRFEVACDKIADAPLFIETYWDKAVIAPGMMAALRKHEPNFDGFIVACHSDPNLDVLKEQAVKPVVGIGEASMKLASMLGHSFSILSTDKHSIPGKLALVRPKEATCDWKKRLNRGDIL